MSAVQLETHTPTPDLEGRRAVPTGGRNGASAQPGMAGTGVQGAVLTDKPPLEKAMPSEKNSIPGVK